MQRELQQVSRDPGDVVPGILEGSLSFRDFLQKLGRPLEIWQWLLGQPTLRAMSAAVLHKVLLQAGIHPTRPAATLLESEAMALYYAVRHATKAPLISQADGQGRSLSPAQMCPRCGGRLHWVRIVDQLVPLCSAHQPLLPVPPRLTPQQFHPSLEGTRLLHPVPNDRMLVPNAAFLLIGPPSAGKTTLSREIAVKVPFVRLIPVVKPRLPRPGEIEGVDAFFVSLAAFERLKCEGAFEMTGTYYGRPFGIVGGLISRARLDGYDAVIVISAEGADQIKAAYSNSYALRLMPPSQEILEQRIQQRTDYGEDERLERLRRIHAEIAQWDRFDFPIITNTIEDALAQAFDIIYSVRFKEAPFTVSGGQP